MKKILILFMVAFTTLATQAQTFEKKGPESMPFNTETKEFEYKETIQIDSVGQQALMIRAQKWFENIYKNPKSVIKEKTDSTIVGKYQFNLFNDASGTTNTAGFCHYTITITCVDNAYTYDITRINFKSASYLGIEKWLDPKNKKEEALYARYFKQIAEHFDNLTASLKDVMDARATSRPSKVKTTR